VTGLPKSLFFTGDVAPSITTHPNLRYAQGMFANCQNLGTSTVQDERIISSDFFKGVENIEYIGATAVLSPGN